MTKAEIRYTTPDGVAHTQIIDVAMHPIVSIDRVLVGGVEIRPENIRVFEESRDNYSNFHSHRWRSQRAGGSSYEMVTYCADCGCEYCGDPAEFPGLEYPHCDSREE